MLVGNKCDENSLREVSEMEGKAEAATWGISFMETSAKNNINVTELFQVGCGGVLHVCNVWDGIEEDGDASGGRRQGGRRGGGGSEVGKTNNRFLFRQIKLNW